MLKALTLALSLSCAGAAYAEPAKPLADRLAELTASIVASPCDTDTDCEARAMQHGIAPDLLEAIDACEESEGEDEDACAIVDDALAKDGQPA